MSEDVVEKIKQFYINRNIYQKVTNKNYYEYVYSLEYPSKGKPGNLIPSFGSSSYAGEGDADLEDYLKHLALEKGVTVSVAESCTGGLVANRITNVPGCSDYFKGGVVAYSNSTKISFLGVLKEEIVKHGAVSSPVAEEMCRGVATRTGSDYAVSVTGITGPSGGTGEKPVGTVWFGLSTPLGTETKRMLFTGSREDIKFKASSFAIFNLMRKIRNERHT